MFGIKTCVTIIAVVFAALGVQGGTHQPFPSCILIADFVFLVVPQLTTTPTNSTGEPDSIIDANHIFITDLMVSKAHSAARNPVAHLLSRQVASQFS